MLFKCIGVLKESVNGKGMEKKKLKGNLLLSTIYQVLTIILPLITTPYVARILGADGTGIYSYTHAYVMYFTLFAALGTESYGRREIARNRDRRAKRSQTFWEITILSIISSTISIIAWGIWILANTKYRIYYLILTLNLFGTMFDISWFYSGIEEIKYSVILNGFYKILGAAAIFSLIKSAEDLWKYILVLSGSTLLANISMWAFLPKFVNEIPLKSVRLKKHFKETLIYFVPTIAISLYTILDKTLIGLITKDTSENGNYEQATKIINMAKTVCFAGINVILSARTSYLYSENKFEEIKRSIFVSIDYVLFIGIGICFGVIGVADRFVPLFFGQGYYKTIELLQLMSPLVVIIGISNSLGSQYYTPAGLRLKSAKFIIIGSLVNLSLNALLIPIYKSSGAVAASIIAETIISGLYLYWCNGFYRVKDLLKCIWKKLLAGAIMLVIVSAVGEHIGNMLIALFTQIIVGIIVYFIILLLMQDSFVCNFLIPQMRVVKQR